MAGWGRGTDAFYSNLRNDNYFSPAHCLKVSVTDDASLPHEDVTKIRRQRMEAVSKQTRRELITALRERYRLSPKAAKGRILDEFVGVSGFHRKHAVRLLAMNSKSVSVSPSVGQCIYDEATRQALILVWEAVDRICGKRLKAIIPDLLTAMEKHGHLKLEGEVRRRVESASAATIDRLLRSVRKSAGSRRRKRPGKKMTREIPVKTCHDWHDPQPGFLEIDFVVHSGGSMAGEYLHSLVATDVCSGWTEAIPLIAREQSLVVEGLRRIGGRAVAAHRNGSGSAHRNGARRRAGGGMMGLLGGRSDGVPKPRRIWKERFPLRHLDSG